jgi:hypothetical protein
MSDTSISLVPKKSTYANNKIKAKEILDWLVAKDIVKSTLTDCVYSDDGGYEISEGAKYYTIYPEDLPYEFSPNGLQIVTEREIFHAGENGLEEIICPKCKENIADDDFDFDPWSNMENDDLHCPQCENKSEIHKYKFEPEWGFSDLGFTFWNWPDFTEEFIKEFEVMLNCEISIVNQHL